MAGGYTDVKRKRRPKPGERAKKFFRISLPVALILSIAAAYELIRSQADSGPTEAIVKMPYGSLEELSDTASFLKAYLAVNAGGEVLETTRTISITGRAKNDSISRNFRLFKKRPNLLRFTTEAESADVTIGYDGREVWQRIRQRFADDQIQTLSGTEASRWINQARFFDRIVSAHLGIGHITGIAIESYQGVDYLAVSTVGTDGGSAITLVDPTTMYPFLEREAREEGMAVTEFGEYRKVGGIPLPFLVVSKLDGELISRTELKSAKLNEGILDRFFAKPKGSAE